MTRVGRFAALAGLGILLAWGVGCEKRADGRWHFSGEPEAARKWLPPGAVTGFETLVRQNCTGCHGFAGAPGAALALDNPVWVRFITPEALRETISHGRAGTRMPAFAREAGGHLTREQVGILVTGILSKGDAVSRLALPPYAGGAGEVAAGRALFSRRCAMCHGQAGEGGRLAGAVVDPSYLALVSDQYLRGIIVAGRPELRMPPAGSTLSGEDVSDLVAWLASHRRKAE